MSKSEQQNDLFPTQHFIPQTLKSTVKIRIIPGNQSNVQTELFREKLIVHERSTCCKNSGHGILENTKFALSLQPHATSVTFQGKASMEEVTDDRPAETLQLASIIIFGLPQLSISIGSRPLRAFVTAHSGPLPLSITQTVKSSSSQEGNIKMICDPY